MLCLPGKGVIIKIRSVVIRKHIYKIANNIMQKTTSQHFKEISTTRKKQHSHL